MRLKEVLDDCTSLDISITIMIKARKILKDLEIAYRAQKAGASGDPSVAVKDPMEEARKKRVEASKDIKFDVKNLPNLRSAEEYASGALLDKGQVRCVLACIMHLALSSFTNFCIVCHAYHVIHRPRNSLWCGRCQSFPSH